MRYQAGRAAPTTKVLTVAVAALVLSSAVLPATAEIWGVKTHDPFSVPPSTLFRFDEDGGSFSVIGEITLDGIPVDVDGLAIDAAGELFAFVSGDASGQLISIDPVTALATSIGILSGREIRGAVFTAAGKLVGVDIIASALVEIEPTTGQQVGPAVALTLADEPFAAGNVVDLAIDHDGSAILSSGGFELYQVDLATGAVTFLMSDTEPSQDGWHPSGAGLAFPTDAQDPRLFVFDVNFDEDIFAYDLEASFARTLVYADIIPEYNAGRGDLASYPFGLVAVPDGYGATPERPRMLPVFPNPFNPQTTVTFSLPSPQHATVSVIDLAGAHVITLANRNFTVGLNSLAWNGLDAQGYAMPSGTYFFQLVTQEGVQAQKATLLR